ARLGRREPRGRARHVELAAAAEVEAHAREVQRLALRVEIRARDDEALLRAAQVEIRARDFGRDEHLRVAEVRFPRLAVRGRGLRAAPHSAEQVELPKRRERDLVRLDLEPFGAEARLLRIASAVRGLDVDAWPALAPCRLEHRTRFLDARGRDLEIEVA